jgi:hypothetical protein
MQTADIDLKKNPEIADWASDMQPGDKGCLYFTIKAKDEQTMQITFDEVGDDESEDEETEDETAMGGNEGSGMEEMKPTMEKFEV